METLYISQNIYKTNQIYQCLKKKKNNIAYLQKKAKHKKQ